MQAGFTCLEAGSVRSKNSSNVVMKNLLDLSIAFLFYGLFGFGIMFYSTSAFFGGFHPIFNGQSNSVVVFFLFQAMFCATAMTIISGAVAERMSFVGYLCVAMLVSGFVYPIVGNWVWGGNLSGTGDTGWLLQLGFFDYAGATVVHSVGGWVALAAVMIIGPRIGRFGVNGGPINGSSITLTAIGSLLIWIGWLGFNGGSLLRFDESVATIILNTLLGGTSGMLSAVLVTYLLYRKALVVPVINGGLIGLIAVTGSANILIPYHAILFGFIAGPLFIPVNALLNKLEIDDAIGVIPVHLFGGIFATIVTGFVIPLSLEQTRFDAVSIQVLGVIAVGAFTFIFSYACMYLINKMIPLRVSTEHEIMGLNVSEHNLTATNADMISQISENLKTGDVLSKIEVDPNSDSFEIAKHYNDVVSMFDELNSVKQEALESAVYHANHDVMTGLFNRYALNKAIEKEHTGVTQYSGTCTVALIDIDRFKSVNDTYGHDIGDKAIIHIANILRRCTSTTDIVARAGGEEFCILLTETSSEESLIKLEQVRQQIELNPLVSEDYHIQMTISIGVAAMDANKTASLAMKYADKALYEAKRAGRNQVVEHCDDMQSKAI